MTSSLLAPVRMRDQKASFIMRAESVANMGASMWECFEGEELKELLRGWTGVRSKQRLKSRSIKR